MKKKKCKHCSHFGHPEIIREKNYIGMCFYANKNLNVKANSICNNYNGPEPNKDKKEKVKELKRQVSELYCSLWIVHSILDNGVVKDNIKEILDKYTDKIDLS